MATGALSSLGIGSNVLTYDIIEKLREVDESGKIKPIDTKIEKNLTRQKDLTQITGYLKSLKSSASALSSDILFQGRDVSTNGTSTTLTADAGVSTGSISIDVIELASKDIYQSFGQKSNTTSLGLPSGDISLSIGGKEFNISVASSTTLTELAEKINEATGNSIQAKVLNVGGKDPFKLIIQSAKTGSEEIISFGGSEDILNALGLNNLGEGEANENNRISSAKNAVFKYDDITMERSSNTIDDITVGLTLNLTDTGRTTFNISQDKKALADEMNSFVTAYNDLLNNLSVAVDYDTESGNAGSLQGVSQVASIKNDLNRIILGMDEKGRTLDAYGLSLQDGGLLKFDESILQKKLNEDSLDVEDFFKGTLSFEPTKYRSQSNVSAGALSITGNSLKINGANINFTTSASATSQENAQALRDAINSANIKGVVASLDSSKQRITLTSKDGGNIEIGGQNSTLSSLGLSNTTLYNEGKQSTGVFSKLGISLENMLGSKGSLTLFDNELTGSQNRLKSERERAVLQLDSKYQTMAAQFAAYDSIIANLNSQFSTLQSMIDSEINSRR